MADDTRRRILAAAAQLGVPRQPAGPGPAAGPHHHLRPGHQELQQPLSLRIGPDVSVIGHDDLPTSEMLDPPLATIRLDGRGMGRALMARLLGGDRHDDYVAPAELVERASLRAPGIPVNPLFTSLSAATR